MFEYFKGKIIEINPSSVVLDVNNIGYVLMISMRSFDALSSKEDALLYIHQYYMRDDLPVLYGFATRDEREIFRLLISVSGVGGNSARAVLSTYNSAELQQIISTGNSAMLKKVKGFGQKSAEKVIVELRDKIISVEIDRTSDNSVTSGISGEVMQEALQALVLLGFKRDASQKSVRDILSKDPQLTVEQVIKRVLKSM